MSTYNYKPGLGSVGSYQVSGIPYVKGPITNASTGGGPFKLTFPQVTKFISVTNTDAADTELLCGFSSLGLSELTNVFVVPGGQTLQLELKVTELYYTGSISAFGVVAGLTGIPNTAINNPNVSPSGSNWSGSLGALVG